LQQEIKQKRQEEISYPGLPLAVYRELSAHLQQIKGITTQIIPQQSVKFDYEKSQVNSLLIKYDEDLDPNSQDRLKEILNYYAEKHGKTHSLS